ncbi:MAG: hypothetical protein JRJ00_00020 [Deltaproteobacteria bacterium]|nr:hypothetical protein [Deltaproteobacteria bacterium]
MTSDESIKRYIKDLRAREPEDKVKEILPNILKKLGFSEEKIEELMK